MAEQLELLFDAPPAAPGRTAAEIRPPARNPTILAELAGFDGPPRKSAHNGAVTRPRQQSGTWPPESGRASLGQPWAPNPPRFRRGVRWWGGRSGVSAAAVVRMSFMPALVVAVQQAVVEPYPPTR